MSTPDPFYYLANFKEALAWVVDRNSDLLSMEELSFNERFLELPFASQALLVRLIMRRGQLFRRSKIAYPEIDAIDAALRTLIDIGWLDPAPPMTLHELFRLATRRELAERFDELTPGVTKQDAYDMLAERHTQSLTFQEWLSTDEPVYLVTIVPIVLQFRLLHFGNFYQQWHEYTLAHLNIFNYEKVEFDRQSRPFESRSDIEFFYALYRCYEAFNEGATLLEVNARLPDATTTHTWLLRRWDRLRYQIGQSAEREGQLEIALQLYSKNSEPEARVRGVRVLERLGNYDEAAREARLLLSEPKSEIVVQKVNRIVARLERRTGQRRGSRGSSNAWPSVSLQLAANTDGRVERRVQMHLSSEQAPVFYVENGLIGSLFGLLCWDAIFQPLRGAFFHRFHAAPVDLGCPDFVRRRHSAFEACLHRLVSGEYRTWIMSTFHEKYGTAAPFVHWQLIDDATLHLALECIDAEHLALYFQRLLDDISENATGLPDLVQFFPEGRTYKLIEVKGPGDRLQDNQRRWLDYCVRHRLPVEVCQVSWA
jgi:hypothetical protein